MSLGVTSNYLQNNFKALNPNDANIYEFEDFRLDAAHLMLYKSGQSVPLTPKVIETLVALVERRGEVVGKDELMNRLWAETAVEESNLSQNLYVLRKTLGKRSDGRPLIETFRRRGYRFNGEIKSSTTTEFLLATHTKTQTIIEETIEHKTHRAPKDWLIACGIIGGLLILSGFVFLSFRNRQTVVAVTAPAQNISLKRLTPDIYAYHPALSPDGKYLAYVKRENEKFSIWLKDMTGGGNAIQTMPTNTESYGNLQFSPDGTQLYYTTDRRDTPNSTICRIPIFGGAPQEIARDVVSPFTISPDGNQLAFVRGWSLIIANAKAAEAKGERELIKLNYETEHFVAWGSQPSWSPDGSRIAICGERTEAGRKQVELMEISVSDGARRNLIIPDWSAVDDTAWLADGGALLVTAREKEGEPFQIWRVPYPEGQTVRVTNDSNDYESLSLTRDSRTLIAQQSFSRQNIWLASLSDPAASSARQLTSSTVAADGYSGLTFTPDGKIIFTSPRSGNVDLWTMNADGSNQQQLTANAGNFNGSPRVTPDGRYIIFVSSRTGTNHVWRIESDGGRNPVQLTHAATEESAPNISPDGNWIYYTTASERPSSVWRISINGGQPVRLSGKIISWSPIPSPDGKLLACYLFMEGSEKPWKIGIMSADGGEPLKLLDIAAFRGIVRWTADSKSLLYIKGVTGELWQQPLDNRPAAKIFDFQNERLYNFAISPDYSQILFSRGNESSEAVLIGNFGKE